MLPVCPSMSLVNVIQFLLAYPLLIACDLGVVISSHCSTILDMSALFSKIHCVQMKLKHKHTAINTTRSLII